MDVYTKKGDDGTTGLFYGGRVSKDDSGARGIRDGGRGSCQPGSRQGRRTR